MDFDEDNLYHPKNIDLYKMMYTGKGDITYLSDRLVSKCDGTVLELACGMGRVILELVRRFPGRSFVGLDYHDAYLNKCVKIVQSEGTLTDAFELGRLRLVEGDMSDMDSCLPPDKKYSVIILCNSSFLHLETTQQRTALLKGVKNRLEQRGVFLLEYALDFWRTWDWKEKTASNIPYRIRKRNTVSQDGLYSTRSFEFTNLQSDEVRTVSVTPWLFEPSWLMDSLRENGLKILLEDNAFQNESGMRRRILHIGHAG